MTIKDAEFLLWISKRLVFKYKENPNIINIVENIIKNDPSYSQKILENKINIFENMDIDEELINRYL